MERVSLGDDITVYVGDCREVLAALPDASVHCCITSPPYFGLRDYGVNGQIGLETGVEEYVQALVAVFREARRVLRKDGTLWLNLGDSYAGSWGDYNPTGTGGQRPKQTERWQRAAYKDERDWRPPTSRRLDGLKPKDLIGVPWRVAFALQADDWYLRSDIIWAKPNPMPESVTDRPTRAHEYVFLLAKSERYYYDAEAIKEVATSHLRDKRYGPGAGPRERHDEPWNQTSRGRNRRDVWVIATEPTAEAHFATFPRKLVEPMVLAGTSAQACPICGAPWARVVERTPMVIDRSSRGEEMGEHGRTQASGTMVAPAEAITTGWRPTCSCGGNDGSGKCIVLDPFAGSGTTLMVAASLGRRAIGVELNPTYVEIAKRRLASAKAQRKLGV